MSEFIPPSPAEFSPPSGSDGVVGSSTSFNSAPRTERERIIRSVAKSGKIRTATSAVIQTRAQLVQYLRQNGLDLVTYAVTFQQTGDFLLSSFVVYPKHNNVKEPLIEFLKRYPNLQQPALAIRDKLRPVQASMQVRSNTVDNSIPGFGV